MILDLSKPYITGLYIITNNVDRYIIIASKNLARQLLLIHENVALNSKEYDPLFIQDLKNGKLSLVLLEDCSFQDESFLHMRLSYYLNNKILEGIDDYSNQIPYSHQRSASPYVTSVRIISKANKPNEIMFAVYVGCRGDNKICIGMFSHKLEAKEWMKQYYSNGINGLIIANNDLTKKYYE